MTPPPDAAPSSDPNRFPGSRPEYKMKTMNPEERFERIERQLESMAGIQAQFLASQKREDAEIAG